MALFGEKYGEEVRVIRFGSSVELCGGTHIGSTGNIGSFRIISESSIAAGIRRIEAISAEACEKFFYAQQDAIREMRSIFHNTPNLIQALQKVLEEDAELKKQVEEFMREKAALLKKTIIENKKEIHGITVFTVKGPFPAEVIKDIAFRLRGEFPEKMYFVAATKSEGKPMLTVMISDDLVAQGMNAGQIVREAAKKIQGGGGGQPHFATAGGKDVDGLSAALDEMLVKIEA